MVRLNHILLRRLSPPTCIMVNIVKVHLRKHRCVHSVIKSSSKLQRLKVGLPTLLDNRLSSHSTLCRQNTVDRKHSTRGLRLHGMAKVMETA
jgi:hypothetical protein